MAITPFSIQPNSITRPGTFNVDSDTYHSELPMRMTEMNALAASMNSIATGGLAIPYTFSTAITDADPGAHFLRLSDATQDASTAIRLSITDAQDSDRTNQIALFDDSTSTVKGCLLLMDASDATKFIFFSVSALSALGSPSLGYHNVTVAKVQSSSASPFANNASLLLAFTRTGDKGDVGNAPSVGSTTSSATPTINTDTYDIYKLTAQAENITSFTTNLSGTPSEGQILIIEITGTAARAITWGSAFESSTVQLPTTTVLTNMLTVGLKYNSATSKWRCIGVA